MDPHTLVDRLLETTRHVRETDPEADALGPLSVVIEDHGGNRSPVKSLFWDPAQKVFVISDEEA